MVRKAAATIAAHSMIADGDRVLAGVSGGMDSVVLLHVLEILGEAHGWGLGIAHMHHGLRGEEADRDAAFVEGLAKTRNVPYYKKRVDLHEIRKQSGKNLEEAGRDARYRFFEEIAGRFGYDRIAVGHHQEDDAELILMNMLRGSGPTGMSGIPPVRGRIVRPLINCRQKEIESFLHSENIAYVHDRSNDNTRFRRNRIRHLLIPVLEQYNPRVVENLHRMGQISAGENRWLESLVSPVFEKAVSDRNAESLAMDTGVLASQPEPVGRRMVRRAILAVKGSLRRIAFRHVDAVLELARVTAGPGGQLHLPGNIRVSRRLNGKGADVVVFISETKPLRTSAKAVPGSPVFSHIVTPDAAVSCCIDIPEAGCKMIFSRLPAHAIRSFPGPDTAVADWDGLEFPLRIRNVFPGDRFVPLGLKHSQKLKKFFINNKVPRRRRPLVPLVTSAERIVWIAGMRMDDRFRVTGNTRSVLVIRREPLTTVDINHTYTDTRAEEF